MIQTQEQTYQERFDMYMLIEKEQLVKMLIECNKHLGTKIKALYIAEDLFPESYKFLENNFTYNHETQCFKSKRKQLGGSTGDDRSLFIDNTGRSCLIYWVNNRGQEDTIFDGKELKTEKEFNQVFELLEINKILKWI